MKCSSAGKTPPFLDENGERLPNSIAEANYYRLGGVNQWVLIRGQNVNENPLLVMLHGGPGISELAFWRYYNSKHLEQHFTVVYWDQRGSGKSYDPSGIPLETMTVEQFLSDLDELIDIVCKQCHKDKVILFGHSWGSVLGPLYASKNPNKVAIYVGSGQIGDWAASEVYTYNYVLELAKQKKNQRAIRQLEKVGPPPHDVNGLCTQRNWLHELDDDMSFRDVLKVFQMFHSVPETRIWDMFSFWKILRFSIHAMWTEVTRLNLNTMVPELQMPCFFFLGRNDHCVPSENSIEYIDSLKAPLKEIVWFEESKHIPSMDEPEKFNELVVKLVKPAYDSTVVLKQEPEQATL
jgi:pimeloyl-ACP methyl ester carboxylesterase